MTLLRALLRYEQDAPGRVPFRRGLSGGEVLEAFFPWPECHLTRSPDVNVYAFQIFSRTGNSYYAHHVNLTRPPALIPPLTFHIRIDASAANS